MSDLGVFLFEQRTPLRLLDRDGEVWFVLNDVCQALNLTNPRQAAQRLDDDEKGVTISDTPGGQQLLSVVNEAGLYSLILTSRKAEARRFKRWVTHEVLPSLRRTGK
jgi:prophage antirepressor-like protein